MPLSDITTGRFLELLRKKNFFLIWGNLFDRFWLYECMHCPPCLIFFCLALLKMKRHPSLLLPGCLQVSDDSLSSRVYQSAPVQLSLPPTFCPLAFAVISDDHSRFGSWKKPTDCEHAETQACLLSSGLLQHDTGFLFFIFFFMCYVSVCLPAR